MAEKTFDINSIPREKFEFAHEGERLMDKKFDDKPISYFRDAWIRFRKNKASVVALIIIICVALFSFLCPLVSSLKSTEKATFDKTFMDVFYSKKGPRNEFLGQFGIADGTVERSYSEKFLVYNVGIGVGAADGDAHGATFEEGLASPYQPLVRGYSDPVLQMNAKKQMVEYFFADSDVYLEVGFIEKSIEQAEYKALKEWEEETGLQVIYPLVAKNEFNADPANANNWYKTQKNNPVTVDEDGNVTKIKLKDLESGKAVLEDNYERDADGNVRYFAYSGSSDFDAAMFRVRLLYYNYYQFKNGFAPEYIFGTDSQGYDLAIRMADGIRLSILVAVFVSVINFVLGAMYGAVEGYYGGTVDIILERVSDILAGIPFIVVATLFQLHLKDPMDMFFRNEFGLKSAGPIVCLLFAYVATGWIGTASRVRTQFYRFKSQEYVMAARTLGASDRRIIWKHIFPNTLGTIITSSALVIPGVINSESMLSYLGIVKLGTAEATSLGTLLSDASSIWTNYPHLLIFPALILSLLMICFNLFGNGLRDAFNPSLRGVED